MRIIITESQALQIKLRRRMFLIEEKMEQFLEREEELLSTHSKLEGPVFESFCDGGLNSRVDSFVEDINELISGRSFEFNDEGEVIDKKLSKDEEEMEEIIREKVETSLKEKLRPIYQKWCGSYRRLYEKFFGITEDDRIRHQMKLKMADYVDKIFFDKK